MADGSHAAFASNSVQLAYGEHKDGRMVHVGAVPQGLACGCVCPACKSPLVARKGAVKVAHFAHHADRSCANALETMLHRLAKQVIADRLEVALPAVQAHGHTLQEATLARFDRVVLEQWLDPVRPDIVAARNGRRLLIEIHVTNPCDPGKLAKLAEAGLSAIEIDLSRAARDLQGEALDAEVIRRAPRAWLWHPLSAAANARALAQAQQEHERRQAAAETAAKAKAGALRQAAATPFLSPGLERPIIAASILLVERSGCGDLVGLPVSGDECFVTRPLAWQSVLIASMLQKNMLTPWPASPDALLNWLDGRGMVRPAFLRGGDEDLAPGWPNVWERLPGLRAPLDVLDDYVTMLAERGMLEAVADGRWTPSTDWQAIAWECLASRDAADRRAVDLQERTVRVLAAAQAATTADTARRRHVASKGQAGEFDMNAWFARPLAGWDGSPASLARRGGPVYGRLVTRLDELAGLGTPHAAVPDGEGLGLPVAAALAEHARQVERRREDRERTEAERQAIRAREKAEADRRRAADRLETLTQAAYDHLDNGGHAWLTAPRQALDGRSVVGSEGWITDEHLGGMLRELREKGVLQRVERGQAKALDKARKALFADAASIMGDERAETWLRGSNPALKGQRPRDACSTPEGMALCRALLRPQRRK